MRKLSHLRACARLSAADRRLVVRALFTVIAIRVAMAACTLRAVRRAVKWIGQSAGSAGTAAVPAERVAWAVSAASRVVPGMTCLGQALAAETLLGRIGHPVELRIGVAKNGSGALEAHAWLESRGTVVYGGNVPNFSRYIPLPPAEPARS